MTAPLFKRKPVESDIAVFTALLRFAALGSSTQPTFPWLSPEKTREPCVHARAIGERGLRVTNVSKKAGIKNDLDGSDE